MEPDDSSDAVVDDNGEVLEAQLAQVNIEANVDKFYHVKVVAAGGDGGDGGDGGSYDVRTHWGRTGTEGQTKTESYSTLAAAVVGFERKFKEKAGVPFSERQSYVAGPNKYSFKTGQYDRVKETHGVVWQYYVSDHVDGKEAGWYDYFKEASDIVEGVYREWQANRSWLDVRSVQSGHWSYTVDFNKQTQQNEKTKKTRNIRRSAQAA